MTSSRTPITFHPSWKRRLVPAVISTLVISNAVLYFQLKMDINLTLRLGGFIPHPFFLGAVVGVLVLYRWQLPNLDGILNLVGRPGSWVAALLLPILAYGGSAMVALPTYGTEPGWKWISLAVSGLTDLPILIIWLAPGLMVLGWVLRRPLSGLSGVILSSMLWIVAHGGAIWFAWETASVDSAVEVAAVVLGAGLLAWGLEQRGASLAAVGAVVSLVLCHLLLHGSNEPALTGVFLGADVTELKGLLPRTVVPMWLRVGPPLIAGVVGAMMGLRSSR